MFRLRSVLGICILVLADSVLAMAGDGGDYTIRANTSEVRVLFTATDSQGRRVTQLQPKDVAVVDNEEVVRRFRSFGPADETPLNVVIMVDTSASLARQITSEIELVKNFIQSSNWRAGDLISVVTFSGTHADVICSRNCRENIPGLTSPRAGNATPLYDALLTASELIARTHEAATRSAIIVLSDGGDNISMHTLAQAIAAAQAVDASVYTVNTRAQRADAQGDGALEQLAVETGGVAYAPGRATALTLNAVLDDLRQGFVLTYECPSSAAAHHEIRVVPALDSHLRFHSRQSYTALSADQ